MKFVILFFLLITPFFPFFIVSAEVDCKIESSLTAAEFLKNCGKGTGSIVTTGINNGETSMKEQIKKIAERAISVGALIAVGAIVWAGIQYTKAYGEDESIKKAKNTGIYALIGLVLLLAAFGLVDIFINFLFILLEGNSP